jgi:myosin-5
MNSVGLSEQEQDSIFCVVAALLHASNLRFVPKSTTTEDCKVYEKDGTLVAVASLLGLTEDAMRLSLTSSVIEARGERLIKRLSMEQAEKALEALIKATYAGLFALLVQRINESIEVHKDGRDPGHLVSFAAIGVLDIFGFESFESNSFERKSNVSIVHVMQELSLTKSFPPEHLPQSYASTTAMKLFSNNSIVLYSKQSRPNINTKALSGRT